MDLTESNDDLYSPRLKRPSSPRHPGAQPSVAAEPPAAPQIPLDWTVNPPPWDTFYQQWVPLMDIGEGAFGKVSMCMTRDDYNSNRLGQVFAVKRIKQPVPRKDPMSLYHELCINKLLKEYWGDSASIENHLVLYSESSVWHAVQDPTWAASPYVRGMELGTFVDLQGSIPQSFALSIIRDLINGLDLLHHPPNGRRPLAHLDLNMSNVIIDFDSSERSDANGHHAHLWPRAKIIDFGNAQVFEGRLRKPWYDSKNRYVLRGFWDEANDMNYVGAIAAVLRTRDETYVAATDTTHANSPFSSLEYSGLKQACDMPAYVDAHSVKEKYMPWIEHEMQRTYRCDQRDSFLEACQPHLPRQPNQLVYEKLMERQAVVMMQNDQQRYKQLFSSPCDCVVCGLTGWCGAPPRIPSPAEVAQSYWLHGQCFQQPEVLESSRLTCNQQLVAQLYSAREPRTHGVGPENRDVFPSDGEPPPSAPPIPAFNQPIEQKLGHVLPSVAGKLTPANRREPKDWQRDLIVGRYLQQNNAVRGQVGQEGLPDFEYYENLGKDGDTPLDYGPRLCQSQMESDHLFRPPRKTQLGGMKSLHSMDKSNPFEQASRSVVPALERRNKRKAAQDEEKSDAMPSKRRRSTDDK